MWHWHGGWGAGDWLTMTLMMVLMWVPIIVIAVLLIRAFASPGTPAGGTDVAEDEARRAYARGDIDRERFQEIVAELRRHRAGT